MTADLSPARPAAPAQPGDPLDRVDTPALLVDLDAFERNLERLRQICATAGVDLRPHAKMHKSADVAKRQMATGGAVGVCCQKLSEAEALAAAGVADILIANEVVAPRKLERLAALARRIRLGVCVDHPIGLRRVSAAARAAGAQIDVLVELDVGAGRCGVAPGAPAADLALAADRAEGVRLRGLQAYNGAAQHVRAHAERAALVDAAARAARETAERVRAAGAAVETITGGGTGTYDLEVRTGVYTEIQCGSYAFMDADYAANLGAEGALWSAGGAPFEQALWILAEVMSAPGRGRAVCDAGHKAAAIDSGPPALRAVLGRTSAAEALPVYASASDEHGALSDPGGVLAIGDRVLLAPGHIDPTVNLHDWMVAVRRAPGADSLAGAAVEAVWPVTARGCVF